MGGYGSTRWTWHNKATPVEDCHKLDVFGFKDAIRHGRGYFGAVTWYRGRGSYERKTGSISYRVERHGDAPAIRLLYSIGDASFDYPVMLTPTHPYFGGQRWWWVCPLTLNGQPCLRRVGVLYLPPGGRYFGCRHCYRLTYTSCQESHQYDSLFAGIGAEMGITGKEVQRLLKRRGYG